MMRRVLSMKGSEFVLSTCIRGKKLHRLFAALLFLMLLWQVFSHATYLFRNADYGSRAFILDFHLEEENSLDVVYIGGSNVYCYYDTMIAWEKYGITSYCYSVPQMDAGVMLSAIKDVLQSQSPQLIICDVRKFLSSCWYDEITMGVRNVLDSYDVDFDRLEAVDYYRRINGFSFHEMLPEYLDLIYYHTNYSALASAAHWDLVQNSLGGGYRTA